MPLTTLSKIVKKITCKNVKKTIDKYKLLCYTIIRKRERDPERKGDNDNDNYDSNNDVRAW